MRINGELEHIGREIKEKDIKKFLEEYSGKKYTEISRLLYGKRVGDVNIAINCGGNRLKLNISKGNKGIILSLRLLVRNIDELEYPKN